MCGIVGLMRFDGQPVDQRQLAEMRDAMFHRGPDDGGIYVDQGVGLGHRRLSIVDLTTAGHQPMTNEDGTIWIVFNGEIYNYVELRAELVARGHQFSSHTDTEVIIHLYEEEGERCVERLGGMFAFVLWDSKRKRFFGARDRIGIKPFHYYADARQFVCASEVKALLACPGVPRSANNEALADYMYAGFPLSDRTLFSGIKQLLPGHTLTASAEGVHIRKYWDVEYRYNHNRSDSVVHAELKELLDDAVRLHCRSDAELGCHLSGGLDSSTVTGHAVKYRSGNMKTFSIRFAQGGWFDETEHARIVAEYAGAEYHEAVPSAADLAGVLPALVWHMEMPLPNLGAFAYYTVSRLASEFVKVTLTGHGGDEVFAGYPAQFQTAFGINPSTPRTSPESPVVHGPLAKARRLGARAVGMGFNGVAKRAWGRVYPRRQTAEDLWASLHVGAEVAENPLFGRRFVSALGGYSPRADYLAAFVSAPTSEVLDRCLYHDLRCYLPGLLYMEDRVSMSVSVESRVPLLDHRIVEYMATIPPLQKVPHLQPKALLRSVAEGVIPESVRNRRDKRPFPTPFGYWIANELRDFSKDVLLSSRALDRGVINADRLRRWELTPNEIWSALTLELWFRIFIDRDATWNDQVSKFQVANAVRANQR